MTTGVPFKLEGQNIEAAEVEISRRLPSLCGTVVDTSGQPVESDFVVFPFDNESALASPDARMPTRTVKQRPDPRGRFCYRGLAPGLYGVATLSDTTIRQDWNTDAFLSTLADTAVRVELVLAEERDVSVVVRPVDLKPGVAVSVVHETWPVAADVPSVAAERLNATRERPETSD